MQESEYGFGDESYVRTILQTIRSEGLVEEEGMQIIDDYLKQILQDGVNTHAFEHEA